MQIYLHKSLAEVNMENRAEELDDSSKKKCGNSESIVNFCLKI